MTSTEVDLYPLTDRDLEPLAALDADLFEHSWPTSQLKALLAGDNFCLGAREGGQLTGYLLGRMVADEGELLQLGVDASSRRTGVGSRLLGSFLDWLRQQDAHYVHLEVRASALPAIACYERAGFTQSGRRKGYYPGSLGREDALLYTLKL